MKMKTAAKLFFYGHRTGVLDFRRGGGRSRIRVPGKCRRPRVFSYRAGPGDSKDTMHALALYGAKHEAVVRAAGQLAARGLLKAYGERQMEVYCLVADRLQFSIADESFSKDGRTCKVTIKSRVSLSDFVSAEIDDAVLEKEEQHFSLQEEMEPTVSPALHPARELSRAYRYIGKHHWRIGNHLPGSSRKKISLLGRAVPRQGHGVSGDARNAKGDGRTAIGLSSGKSGRLCKN